jgi:hypothetical protein
MAGRPQLVDQLSLFLVQVSQRRILTGLQAITFMGVRECDDVRHEKSPWVLVLACLSVAPVAVVMATVHLTHKNLARSTL